MTLLEALYPLFSEELR